MEDFETKLPESLQQWIIESYLTNITTIKNNLRDMDMIKPTQLLEICEIYLSIYSYPHSRQAFQSLLQSLKHDIQCFNREHGLEHFIDMCKVFFEIDHWAQNNTLFSDYKASVSIFFHYDCNIMLAMHDGKITLSDSDPNVAYEFQHVYDRSAFSKLFQDKYKTLTNAIKKQVQTLHSDLLFINYWLQLYIFLKQNNKLEHFVNKKQQLQPHVEIDIFILKQESVSKIQVHIPSQQVTMHFDQRNKYVKQLFESLFQNLFSQQQTHYFFKRLKDVCYSPFLSFFTSAHIEMKNIREFIHENKYPSK